MGRRLRNGFSTKAIAVAVALAATVVTAPAAHADGDTGTPTPPTTTTSDTGSSTTSSPSATTTSEVTTTTPATTTSAPSTTTAPPATTTGTASTGTATSTGSATSTGTPTGTPTSTDAQPADAPAPAVLEVGATGVKVKDLQARLVAAGRRTGPVDGVYDDDVVADVLAYLTSISHAGDGRAVEQDVWDALVAATATPVRIAAGSTGNPVKDVQVRLRLTGAYWPFVVDGYYGSTLAAMVLQFQVDKGLPQSGVLDQRTWTRLATLSASPVLLRPGVKGPAVRDVQIRLRLRGLWPYALDGYFGTTLANRVLAFQQGVLVPQTSVVDSRTWSSLAAVTASPVLLRIGVKGPAVKETQLRLRSRGLWPYAIDGYFGTTLRSKVTAFQQTQNLPYTAVVDQRTWDRLLALTYVPGTFDAARYNAGLAPRTPAVGTLDPRCRTGRALCVSKNTRLVVWVVNGKPVTAMWARFGAPGLDTREGTFSVLRKYEYVISNLYNVPMPYSMFFSGGQAVHYSSNFARLGYARGSHGCVNIKDYAMIRWVFGQVRVGDKVIVYK